MGKDKPRHNPDKPQNQCNNPFGKCIFYEEIPQSSGEIVVYCARFGSGSTKICKGDKHNCCKVKYRIAASRSDVQKENEVWDGRIL